MRTTVRIYLRLLAFARPHWFRLSLGVSAGLISGGAIFGILPHIKMLVEPFQETSTGLVPAPETTRDMYAELGPVGGVARYFDLPVQGPDDGISWQLMMLIAGGLLFFALVKGLATFANRYYMRWIGCRVVMDLRNALFESLQQQSLMFFGQCDVGQLISRATNDALKIENAVAKTIADATRAPMEILAAATFVIIFALRGNHLVPFITLFVIFPLCIIPVVILGHYIKRYTRQALQGVSELVSRMQENFTGIRIVKAFHTEQQEMHRFRTLNRHYFKSLIRALRAELFMTPIMEGVGICIACLFLVYCYAAGIRLSEILAFGAAGFMCYRPIKQLAKVNVSLQRGAAAAERIFELIDVDTALPEAPNPIRLDGFHERIVCENVSFRYSPGDENVVEDITLDIPRGSIVAFVGETGSGKTTLVNLLARFYDPTEGTIRIDGNDVREVEIASLRRLIGVVTQETILFNDTVASNIAYGTEGADRARIEAAARQANAHDFIMAHPDGYERVVGEKGFVLSGGQRQRIAIARAILKNPPILVLDEATSALDTVTEQLVQEAINNLMEHRTVFAVAHRLSTVRHANQICVLRNRHIVERGSHRELYEAGGLYRELCDIQFS